MFDFLSEFSSHFVQNATITYWISKGAPAEKLLLGFPTYGRTFHLTTSSTGLGAPSNGPADAGPYTRDAGYWSYYEVTEYMFVFLRIKAMMKNL